MRCQRGVVPCPDCEAEGKRLQNSGDHDKPRPYLVVHSKPWTIEQQALELVRKMALTWDRNDPSMWCGSARELFERNGVKP